MDRPLSDPGLTGGKLFLRILRKRSSTEPVVGRAWKPQAHMKKRDFQDLNPPRTKDEFYARYEPSVGVGTGILLASFLFLILANVVVKWINKKILRFRYSRFYQRLKTRKRRLMSNEDNNLENSFDEEIPMSNTASTGLNVAGAICQLNVTPNPIDQSDLFNDCSSGALIDSCSNQIDQLGSSLFSATSKPPLTNCQSLPPLPYEANNYLDQFPLAYVDEFTDSESVSLRPMTPSFGGGEGSGASFDCDGCSSNDLNLPPMPHSNSYFNNCDNLQLPVGNNNTLMRHHENVNKIPISTNPPASAPVNKMKELLSTLDININVISPTPCVTPSPSCRLLEPEDTSCTCVPSTSAVAGFNPSGTSAATVCNYCKQRSLLKVPPLTAMAANCVSATVEVHAPRRSLISDTSPSRRSRLRKQHSEQFAPTSPSLSNSRSAKTTSLKFKIPGSPWKHVESSTSNVIQSGKHHQASVRGHGNADQRNKSASTSCLAPKPSFATPRTLPRQSSYDVETSRKNLGFTPKLVLLPFGENNFDSPRPKKSRSQRLHRHIKSVDAGSLASGSSATAERATKRRARFGNSRSSDQANSSEELVKLIRVSSAGGSSANSTPSPTPCLFASGCPNIINRLPVLESTLEAHQGVTHLAPVHRTSSKGSLTKA